MGPAFLEEFYKIRRLLAVSTFEKQRRDADWVSLLSVPKTNVVVAPIEQL